MGKISCLEARARDARILGFQGGGKEVPDVLFKDASFTPLST
jgi:hypothetical protein